jgi:hypothetical protein
MKDVNDFTIKPRRKRFRAVVTETYTIEFDVLAMTREEAAEEIKAIAEAGRYPADVKRSFALQTTTNEDKTT